MLRKPTPAHIAPDPKHFHVQITWPSICEAFTICIFQSRLTTTLRHHTVWEVGRNTSLALTRNALIMMATSSILEENSLSTYERFTMNVPIHVRFLDVQKSEERASFSRVLLSSMRSRYMGRCKRLEYIWRLMRGDIGGKAKFWVDQFPGEG